ncbi:MULTISPECIES: response regulator [Hyphobacterium]|uniref:PleD family two-component system response regulator n=1 Tax=Hyphobacterium vulgare TaxID=1736751 RepID=A0ABV6ZYK8_9PROT
MRNTVVAIDAPAPWREGQTLIVEPGSLFRQLLVGVVREESRSRVVAVGCPQEALDIVRSEAPSLIVMDWAPFDSDGAELGLIRELRSKDNPFERQIPVIVTSSRGRRRDIECARNAGATDYVLKPAAPVQVLRRADVAERWPRPFVQATRFRGPDRRTQARGVIGLRYKRRMDVRAGLVDPLDAARHALAALASEVEIHGCHLTRRVVMSLKSFIASLSEFTERENHVVEIHRAALVQLERARFEGETGMAVVLGLERVVNNRLTRH